MKYQIIEKGLDEYELHYKKGKEDIIIPFKRTVELARKLQGIDAEARFKMLDYLTSIGKSKKDLVIEKTENGKIVVDETNYREFEASFLIQEQFKIAMEIYENLFNKDFLTLVNEMGLNEKEAGEFGQEVREVLINGKTKTPSLPQQEDKAKQNNI